MSKEIPYVSFGEDELGEYFNKGDKATCPNCNKEHKVEFSKDEDGLEGGLISVECPKDKHSYLVGVGGKRIKDGNK